MTSCEQTDVNSSSFSIRQSALARLLQAAKGTPDFNFENPDEPFAPSDPGLSAERISGQLATWVHSVLSLEFDLPKPSYESSEPLSAYSARVLLSPSDSKTLAPVVKHIDELVDRIRRLELDASEKPSAPTAPETSSSSSSSSASDESLDAPLDIEIVDAEHLKSFVSAFNIHERCKSLLLYSFGEAQQSTRRLLVSAPPSVAAIRTLFDEYPVFSEVTRFVEEQLSLLAMAADHMSARLPLYLPPILVAGKPGCGKTSYLSRLSEILGVDHKFVAMNALSAGWIIGGGDAQWQGSKNGLVFDAVVLGASANPLFILDEIDKIGGSKNFAADADLYRLLERHSARKFIDEFAGIPIDASHVIWSATANDVSSIPEPLLSRFELFSIPDATPEQERATNRSVYQAVLSRNSWGIVFESEPPEFALDVVVGLSPREVRRVFERAFGRAAVHRRKTLVPSDFVLPDDGRRRTGFVH